MSRVELPKEPKDEPALIRALNALQQYATLSENKVCFFNALAAGLPDADPRVQTDDGQEVEMLWGDDSRLTITLTDDDSVVVSSAKGEAKFFEKEQSGAAISFVILIAHGHRA